MSKTWATRNPRRTRRGLLASGSSLLSLSGLAVGPGAGVFGFGLVGAGGEDADGALAPPDLVAQGLPGPISHDDPGVGPLGEDEQLVAEAVLREPGGDGKPALPPLPRHEVGDSGFDVGLEVFDAASHGHATSLPR
jgi:hypothetical protein